MANITENELITRVNAKQADAITYKNQIERENNYLDDRYNAEYYGTEVAGRSRFVSNDVKDAVESAHDSLVRMFLGGNPIIKFTATNPKDPEQQKEAEEKTAFIDYLVRGQENSYKTQSSFLTECLKFKAGVLKYCYRDRESTEDIKWEGLTTSEVEGQLKAVGFNLSLDDKNEIIIESSKKNDVGEIVSHTENDDGTYDLELRITTTKQEVDIYTVPNGAFLLSSGSVDLCDAELVGDESYKTRGELISEGHDHEFVANLPTASFSDYSVREIKTDNDGRIAQSDFSEWASQLVPVSDLYVLVDYNNDGIAERRHIEKSGDYILSNEPFDHVPYVCSSALIVPNSVIGESWAEQVCDIQEVNTAITRGTLDNIYAVNNTKKVARVGKNGVNLDEVLSPVIGGVIQARGDAPLADMVQPLLTEFIGDKALLIKQHMDQMKANRVGGQLTSQGLDGDSLSKETATRFTGVEKTNQAKIEKIARNIVETGYRNLYKGIAWIVSHYEMDEVEFSVLGKALKANPSKWKYDETVSTEIGLGAGDNEKIVQNMSAMWQIYQQERAIGSPLVDSVKGYNILNKMYKALDIKDTTMYVNNPEVPEELLQAQNETLNALSLQQQERIKVMEQQLQNPLAEAEMVKREGDIAIAQAKLQLEAAKLEEDKRQFNLDLLQKKEQQEDDIALELTKIESSNRKN